VAEDEVLGGFDLCICGGVAATEVEHAVMAHGVSDQGSQSVTVAAVHQHAG